MSFDWQKVEESKRARRREFAALPIAEKLRLLDALRERELALRSGRGTAQPQANMLRDAPTGYHSSK